MYTKQCIGAFNGGMFHTSCVTTCMHNQLNSGGSLPCHSVILVCSFVPCLYPRPCRHITEVVENRSKNTKVTCLMWKMHFKVNTGAKRRGNYISDLQCQIWLILYLTQISTVTLVMPTPVVYLNQPASVSWPSFIILLLEADWKLQGSLVNYHFRLNNSNLIKA